MTSNPLQTEKRKPLTPRQRIDLMLKQESKCACCEVKFKPKDQFIDEHVIPLWAGGTNEMSNRELWCASCAKAKTSEEATERSDANKMGGRKGSQNHRRKTAKAKGKKTWPTGRKIGKRAFEKRSK